EPKDQARFDRESIVLAGKATSGKGVARVTVAVNGTEVASRGERSGPRNELLFEVPLKLKEGRNVLIVTALDTTGERRQEARTLFYESRGPSASEQALKQQLEEERKKAAEIALKAEQEKKRLEELAQKRLDEEKKKAEQLARLDQEKRTKAEELARKQEEERKKAAEIALRAERESKRLEEEKRRVEELARLEQEKRKKAEQLASLPPMQVTISSPANQSRVENESIGLAGLVSGGRGVSRVTVALNGAEVSRLEERSPLRSMPVNLPVKLREGQNTLVVTATDADGLIQQEVRTVHYEKRAPLMVAFRYPEDRSRVNEETSVVAALVTSSKGVAKVSVILNGAEVHQQSERSPQSSVAVTAPVTLKEGANAIVVNAIEADGNARQEIRTVFYDRPKETVAAPKKPLPDPPRERWAVVIGVGRYESPEVPRLRYTVPDAEAIYETLIKSAGFKKDHVLLLTDRSERRPTLRNVKWALGTFLARSAKKDDTVIIFFAGHGAPEVDQRGVERDGFSKYLVPTDAEPDDLYSTALPMDELQTIFARLEAQRVVVFLDACYSGAAGGRTFASKKTRSAHVDDLFLERATSSKGRAIITASRPSEVSIELPDLGHGIFTYYLLQGLKGAADLNRDGIVSLQELYEYVERQVSQKSRAVGGNQHPVMKGELEGVLPLVKVSAK
ncbi:MAG: caspase family protein, partial [Deltaproteobacteria bacterium]|nr:caspase family protein [Deltaproteobacteria bacterium]